MTFNPELEKTLLKKQKSLKGGVFCCKGRSKDKSEYSVSSCTLRLSDHEMNQQYASYLRKEVRKRGLGVLLSMFVIMLLLLTLYFLSLDDEIQADEILHLLFLFGVPMVALAISYLLSMRKERFAELFGPSMGFSLMLCIGLVNLTSVFPEASDNMKTNEVYIVLTISLIHIGLFNASFVQDVVLRNFCYLVSCSIIISKHD